jgi:hypothetical protein
MPLLEEKIAVVLMKIWYVLLYTDTFPSAVPKVFVMWDGYIKDCVEGKFENQIGK